MARKRRTDREYKNIANAIKELLQIIVEIMVQINEKLDNIGDNTGSIKKSSASKLPVILTALSLLVPICSLVVDNIDKLKPKAESETGTGVHQSGQEPEYKIYLYSEYSTFDITTKIDMTASLNFEADAVSITAHLASGREDTVFLERKNAMEWQKKVEFTETGVHKIVVTATAPNGEVIENSIEVEVTPINIDMDIINQFLNP